MVPEGAATWGRILADLEAQARHAGRPARDYALGRVGAQAPELLPEARRALAGRGMEGEP